MFGWSRIGWTLYPCQVFTCHHRQPTRMGMVFNRQMLNEDPTRLFSMSSYPRSFTIQVLVILVTSLSWSSKLFLHYNRIKHVFIKPSRTFNYISQTVCFFATFIFFPKKQTFSARQRLFQDVALSHGHLVRLALALERRAERLKDLPGALLLAMLLSATVAANSNQLQPTSLFVLPICSYWLLAQYEHIVSITMFNGVLFSFSRIFFLCCYFLSMV